jgi:hypothetical protein
MEKISSAKIFMSVCRHRGNQPRNSHAAKTASSIPSADRGRVCRKTTSADKNANKMGPLSSAKRVAEFGSACFQSRLYLLQRTANAAKNAAE